MCARLSMINKPLVRFRVGYVWFLLGYALSGELRPSNNSFVNVRPTKTYMYILCVCHVYTISAQIEFAWHACVHFRTNSLGIHNFV